jgi:hypothetical protein
LYRLTGVVAVVDDLARHDQLVCVVDRDLHVVARHRLAALGQKPGIRVGPRQLGLAARVELFEACLHVDALGHQCRDLPRDVAAAPAIFATARRRRLRGIVGIERGAISLDLALDLRQPFRELAARPNARLAGVAVEKRAVDPHQFAAQEAEFASQNHKITVRRLERRPVVLAKAGDRPIAGRKPLDEPHQLDIAPCFLLQAPRRADPVQVPIKVKLQ